MACNSPCEITEMKMDVMDQSVNFCFYYFNLFLGKVLYIIQI